MMMRTRFLKVKWWTLIQRFLQLLMMMMMMSREYLMWCPRPLQCPLVAVGVVAEWYALGILLMDEKK